MNNFDLERILTLLGSYFFPTSFIYDKNISDKLFLLRIQIWFSWIFYVGFSSVFLLYFFETKDVGYFIGILFVTAILAFQLYRYTSKMDKACTFAYTNFLKPENQQWINAFLDKKNLQPYHIIQGRLLVFNAVSLTIKYVQLMKNMEIFYLVEKICSEKDFLDFQKYIENKESQEIGFIWLNKQNDQKWFNYFLEFIKDKKFYNQMEFFDQEFGKLFFYKKWLAPMNEMIESSIIGQLNKKAACDHCYSRLTPYIAEYGLQWQKCPICNETKYIIEIEQLIGVISDDQWEGKLTRKIWNPANSEIKFFPLEKIIVKNIEEPDRAIAKLMEVYDTYAYLVIVECEPQLKLSENTSRMLSDWLKFKKESNQSTII